MTPQMTVEETDFDPPMYGETPLADFIDQLRGIQSECPAKVIPMIKFNIVQRYGDHSIEGTIYYPRLENLQEVNYRLKREAREKEVRRKQYEELKKEFENVSQTGLLGSSDKGAATRVHTSPLQLVHTLPR